MRLCVFLCLFIGLCMSCPSTDVAIKCFYDKADTNHDGQISLKELDHAIASRLPWWENAAFKLFGGLKRIMIDCDENRDGYLAEKEAYAMSKTCMNTCYKRSKTIELFDCSSS